MSDVAKWDGRMLALAREVAKWSKDGSTQVGAVIADDQRRIVSIGFNGFARGVDDSPGRYADRETKLRLVVHAELNAILFAARPLAGCTLYTVPFMPCSRCAAVVIQAGISRVVAPETPPGLAARWEEELRLARVQFEEAGVRLVIVGDGK